jgi:hypothetical protein
MYHEIITPESQEISLTIPVAYLKRRIDELVFEVNEGIDGKPTKQKDRQWVRHVAPQSFWGRLQADCSS